MSTATQDGGRRTSGVTFWIAATAGWAVIGYGLFGLLHHHVDTRPANLAKFVVGGALLHDLAFSPLVLLLGALVSRLVGGRARAVVQTALIVCACLALFAYPLVRGYAHVLHNPTSLPFNYAANLGIVLAGVWAIAALMLVLGARRSHRS